MRTAVLGDFYRKDTGKAGEDFVAEKLVSEGWRLVARNWRRRAGEIDIIGVDGDTLVFVEVKTWPCGWQDDLEYVINPVKRRRMIRLAECFVSENPEYAGNLIRFDVVFTGFNPGKGSSLRSARERTVHLRNAFTE